MQTTPHKTQSAARADALRFALQMAEQAQKVGARITYERERRGWSRPELARRMEGLATGNDVYRWELGKHLPRAGTLDAIADVFGISVADLHAGPPDTDGQPAESPLDVFSEQPEGSELADRLEWIESALQALLAERGLELDAPQSEQDHRQQSDS